MALSEFDHTQWAYQPSTGLLQSKKDPDSKSVTYTYWPEDHQLKRRTWARENSNEEAIYTDYAYYSYTRMLHTVDYSDSTPDITNTYTRLGQIDTVLDGQGYRKFVYTDEGALDTETVKVSETGDTLHVIDHAQDAYGRSEGYDLFVDGSSTASLTMDYGYNTQNGRLETIESSAGTYTTYAKYHYVENSDLVDGHAIAASSTASTFFYDRTVYEDNRNLIDRVESGFNSSTDYWSTTETTRRSYYDYTNDDAGRRTARTDWYNPDGTPSTINNSFGYNEHNELETAEFGSDDYDYAYDNIGNRRSSALNSSATSYAPDKLNQYDSVGGKTYRYDADGNLETDGEKWICTWDAENRLTSIRTWHYGEGVVTGDKKYVFAYDYDGRRYKKTTYTYSSNKWVTGTSYSFVWNGNHIIREKWSNGGEKFYTWGLEGKLLSMSAGVYNIYYGYDGNKNVTDLIRNGEYAHRYEYDAFGNITSSQSFIGVIINPFRFSSEYVDNETGWSAYKYRYYSPQIGRFLNRDPIAEQGGLNLYGFVGNDPLDFCDEFGLMSFVDMSKDLKRYLNQHAEIRGGLSKTFATPKFMIYSPPPVWLEANITFAGEVFNCLEYSTGRQRVMFEGSITVEGYVVVGHSLTWGNNKDGKVNDPIRNPNRPKETIKRKKAPDEPASGYRERSAYLEGSWEKNCNICPKEGWNRVSGSVFLRGSGGVGFGYQFNIKKQINSEFTDWSKGWSVTGSRAWGVTGLSLEAGISGTTSLVYYIDG